MSSSWSELWRVALSRFETTIPPVFLKIVRMSHILHSLISVYPDILWAGIIVLRCMIIHWMDSETALPWAMVWWWNSKLNHLSTCPLMVTLWPAEPNFTLTSNHGSKCPKNILALILDTIEHIYIILGHIFCLNHLSTLFSYGNTSLIQPNCTLTSSHGSNYPKNIHAPVLYTIESI